jgi:glycosyltransferase involved in cell wall biosynthesis
VLPDPGERLGYARSPLDARSCPLPLTPTPPSSAARARRIVHVIPSLGFGGCERQLADLIRHGDGSHYTHAIAHLGPPDSLLAELDGAVGPVRDISRMAAGGYASRLRALRAVLRELKPDIVHSWLFEADVAARIAGARLPVRWVTSLAAPAYDRAASRAAGWPHGSVLARRGLDATTARIADPLFVACSAFVARSTASALRLRADRVRVIPNSVAPERLESSAAAAQRCRARLGLSPERFVVLAVGRLDPQKGLDVLLRAAALMRQRVPELAVVVLGEGPMRAQLEALVAQLDLASTVLMPGASFDVADHFAMADAFAFPSRFEGFGMALAEAMTAGLPCVTTALPPVLEFLEPERSGLCCPREDAPALAVQLTRLATEPELRRALRAAAPAAVARLDIRVTARQWHETYDAELSRSS